MHELRAQVDAILVGRGTVERDDPALTARPVGAAGRQPLRVVLDSRARLPLTARVLSSGLPGRTLLATAGGAEARALPELAARGVGVLVLPPGPGGVDLEALLDRLGEREVTSLLVEGGPTVLGSFLARGLVGKVLAFVSPQLVGDGGPPAVSGEGAWTMAQALRLERTRLERLGDDVLVTGYVPAGWAGWASPADRAAQAEIGGPDGEAGAAGTP